MKKVLPFLTFLFGAMALFAQIDFTAKAEKSSLNVGETVKVTYTISTENDLNQIVDIEFPDFDGFEIIFQGQNQSYQSMNGKTKIVLMYSMVLQATKEGHFKLKPAILKLDSDTFKSNSLTLKVGKGKGGNNKPKNNKPTYSTGQYANAFLSAEINNSSPYENEESILTLKFYANNYSYLKNIDNLEIPQLDGMQYTTLELDENNKVKQEEYNGRVYATKEIAKYSIVAEPGAQEIPPFAIDLYVGNYFTNRVISLISDPINLQVKPLPEPKPKDFNGAVGEFKMVVEPSKKTLEHNEKLYVDVEVIGEGNLQFIDLPKPLFPNYFEEYEPKIRRSINRSNKGSFGKVATEYLLVPQYGGKVNIKPLYFTFFNPKTGAYQSIKSKAFSLNISGPEPPLSKTPNQKELDESHKNKSKKGLTEDEPNNILEVDGFFKENQYLITGGLIALLSSIFLFVFFRKKRQKKQVTHENEIENVQVLLKPKQIKNFQETFSPKKALLDLNSALPNPSIFFKKQAEFLKTLGQVVGESKETTFLADTVAEELSAKGLPPELIEQWKAELIAAQAAIYSPLGAQPNPEEKMETTQRLVKEMLKFIS